MSDRIKKLKNDFSELFGSNPAAVVKGPGRVDLMGNHTDYNDGFVLPVAVNVDVLAAGALRDDDTVVVHSANFGKTAQFSLSSIEKDSVNTWSNYVRGVVKFLQEAGVKLRGMNMVLHGNVPIGSGLSSSAAIEMATGVLVPDASGLRDERAGPGAHRSEG